MIILTSSAWRDKLSIILSALLETLVTPSSSTDRSTTNLKRSDSLFSNSFTITKKEEGLKIFPEELHSIMAGDQKS